MLAAENTARPRARPIPVRTVPPSFCSRASKKYLFHRVTAIAAARLASKKKVTPSVSAQARHRVRPRQKPEARRRKLGADTDGLRASGERSNAYPDKSASRVCVGTLAGHGRGLIDR